jgi:flagellar basal body-associated protein FliL
MSDDDSTSPDEIFETSTKGSGTLTIVLIIAIIAVLLLILSLLIFFLVGNKPPPHPIVLQNSTSSSITITGFPQTYTLNPNTNQTVYVQPGQNLNIEAFYTEDGFFEQGYGTAIILNLNSSNPTTNSVIDTYAVSVKNGYNLGATIQPTAFTSANISDPYSCGSPSWNFLPGITGTTINDCPSELQYSMTGTNFQSCLSPCTNNNHTATTGTDYCCIEPGSCQIPCENTWGEYYDYWDLMNRACPTCLITNCDPVNYYCENANMNTPIQYLVTFFDRI